MKKLFAIIAISLLWPGMAAVNGQSYYYVSDEDQYAFVRSEPHSGAPVIDSVAHFQILKVFDSHNGWMVVNYGSRGGYVHGSRLRPMPEDIDKDFVDALIYWNGAFIAGSDVEHIAIAFTICRIQFPKEGEPNLWYEEKPLIVTTLDDGMAMDLRTGEVLWRWEFPTYAARMEIYPGRITVHDSFSVCSFMRGRNGRTSRILIPTFSAGYFDREEIEEAMAQAELFAETARGMSYDQATKLWGRMFGINNFKLLYPLRAAYLEGSDPQGYYPFLLHTAACDGGDCHGLEFLFRELLVIDGAGEVEID